MVLVKVLKTDFFLAHHYVKLLVMGSGCAFLNSTCYKRKMKNCTKTNSSDGKWCCCLEMLKGSVPHQFSPSEQITCVSEQLAECVGDAKMLPVHLGDKLVCSSDAEAVRTEQILLPLMSESGFCVFHHSDASPLIPVWAPCRWQRILPEVIALQ